MQLTTKDHIDGPFHKLKSSFKEIFGMLNDAPNTEAGARKKTVGTDKETI